MNFYKIYANTVFLHIYSTLHGVRKIICKTFSKKISLTWKRIFPTQSRARIKKADRVSYELF